MTEIQRFTLTFTSLVLNEGKSETIHIELKIYQSNVKIILQKHHLTKCL